MIKNFILFCFSLFLSILLAELLVSFFSPQDLSGTWRVFSADKNYMLNKNYGSVRHQLKKIVVNYSFGDNHTRVYSNKMNCEKKILVLGDSFTFGWLLNEKDTFIFKLQNHIENRKRKRCFLNAASGGWGLSEYLAYTQDFIQRIKPDVLLIFLNLDDVSRIFRSKMFKLENGILRRNRSNKNSPTFKEVVNSLPLYNWLLERSHVVNLMRKIILTGFNNQKYTLNESANTFTISHGTSMSSVRESDLVVRFAEKIFASIKIHASRAGSKLFVVTTGWQGLTNNLDDPKNPNLQFFKNTKSFFNNLQVPYFDSSKKMKILRGNTSISHYIIPMNGHPNAKGAELIYRSSVNGILDLLKKHSL